MSYDKKTHYLFICNNKDCLKRGAEELRSSLKAELKEKKLKKHFKLIKTSCMDACKKGPNLVLEGDIHHNASADEIIKKLENMIKEEGAFL